MHARLARLARSARLAAPATLAALALTALSPEAGAFCGFYVGGGEAKLVNNATEVVLLREGTRTVLSMQNNYQGPPEDFAMVVPVPVVLQKDNVRALKKELFDKVERLTAPRLVEYWEQDPCPPPLRMGDAFGAGGLGLSGVGEGGGGRGEGIGLGQVRVEARFDVAEYDVVILSADDGLALDTWLRQHSYKIPDGAEAVLRPYVQGGMKFFVAKVDPKKVRFANGMAELSPLRFHYDSDLFSLPVRLGLLNSNGTQDLIVHVIARGQRYEVANYANVAIPTNLDVLNRVRGGFGSFYASLFDSTMKKHPGAVVTEYAWTTSTCDPCPSPPLDQEDIRKLGGDVAPPPALDQLSQRKAGQGWTVTRLHTRYTKEALGEDLVFKEAPPIVGGRELVQDSGKLETTARQAQINNFQARYAIRHLWNGPITCQNPQRGIWGGPPGGEETLHTATDLAHARRNVPVSGNVTRGSIDAFLLSAPARVASTIPVGIVASPLASALAPEPAAPSAEPEAPSTEPTEPEPSAPAAPAPPALSPPKGGCAGCSVGRDDGGLAALSALALAASLAIRARRRRKHG